MLTNEGGKRYCSVREAYGKALAELGRTNESVVVLEADVGGSTKSSLFGGEFPERYFNMGICELNMVNTAAGLAMEGFTPFVNTFAVFMTSRALDPIQSMVAYDGLNVILAGAYCGLSDSYDGASHQAITDIAVMRTIPGMTVVSVSDAAEAEAAVRALADYPGPAYLRLSRADAPVIYERGCDFKVGKGIVCRDGNDVTLIGTGTVVSRCLEAAARLKELGIDAAVIDMHTIKPIDESLILKYAKRTKAIVTVEEHSVCGGFGSAVAEVIVKRYPIPMDIIGIETFAESGDYEELLDKFGLGSQRITEACRQIVQRKQNWKGDSL